MQGKKQYKLFAFQTKYKGRIFLPFFEKFEYKNILKKFFKNYFPSQKHCYQTTPYGIINFFTVIQGIVQ